MDGKPGVGVDRQLRTGGRSGRREDERRIRCLHLLVVPGIAGSTRQEVEPVDVARVSWSVGFRSGGSPEPDDMLDVASRGHRLMDDSGE